MKKLFHLLIAVQISALAFASRNVVPSDDVLASYYNQGEVCMCFFVPDELNCGTIVVTGSFNSWSSIVAECAQVEPVDGYDGWYVSSFVPEAQPSEWGGIQAKPMMLDASGNFNWEYQVGAVTIIRGGVQVTAGGVSGEIDLYDYGTNAPNVFTVDGWKQNPCTAIYHNYKITVISDGCNNYAVPFIVGVMTNWDFVQMTLDNNKTQANQAPTYTYSFSAAEGLPYQIVSGLWDPIAGEIDPDAMPGLVEIAYMQKLVNGEWVRIPGDEGENLLTKSNAKLVFDLRTDTLRWARCASDTIDPASDLHVEVGGLYYNLDPTTHTAEVTSQVGGKPYWVTEIKTAHIPSTVTYNNVTYSVTRIGNNAFHYRDSLTSVTIPNSVTSIGYEAFYRCIALTSITIPNSVTSIEEKAFWCCSGLTSITIPSSITSIANSAFRACSRLTSITIPNSVKCIGESVFRDCFKLTSITCKAVTPPAMGENVFENVEKSIPLYVPEGSVNAYQTANGWSDFTNIHSFTPEPEPEPEPIVSGYNVIYQISDGLPLDSEIVTLHLPVAPQIAGFSFLKWQVVAGDLKNGIKIQAVYTATIENMPEVVINPANSAQKLIRNGQVYILTGDKTYTITGQEVR